MFATLRRLTTPPRFESEELTQRARMVHVVTTVAMATVAALAIAMVIAQPQMRVRMLTVLVAVQTLGFLALEATRRGHVRKAGIGLVAGIIAVIAVNALPAGGVLSPGIGMYSVIVLMAGILVGEKAGEITAVICTAIGLGFVVAEMTGVLPTQTVFYNPIARWIIFSVYMVMVLVLMRLANAAIAAAMHRVETGKADLAKRVRELRLLHDASNLLRNRQYDAGVLDVLVYMIPTAWQYPDVCAARISYVTVDARTPGFRDSRWRQSIAFRTAEADGVIEVVYLEERPPAAEGPFLAEERSVLVSLADMLAAWLERDVAERRRKAVENQLRQSQKMEALGTLAGGIAHDFNNIIGGIVGQAILGKADAGPGHQSAAVFESILASTGRASDIVNRILLFSRRHEAARKPMTLRSVVEEAIKLLDVSRPKNVRMHTSFGPEAAEISGDASQLFQLVVNLGTNALHAMAPAGGTLTATVDVVTLDETASERSVDLRPGQHVRLTMSDTGAGMSRETLERVFEPFFTTKGTSGTGLGLSVVHGIVKDHEGAITVESEVGRGTTVSVYFPAARPAATSARSPATAPRAEFPPEQGGGQHVMFVDDDEAIRGTLPRIIKRLGYRCTVFDDPGTALSAFRDNPNSFDLVLTDFTMPTMNGVELAQQIKLIRPSVPIALVTGYGVDAAAAASAGIDVRIGKPVSLDELAQSLRTLQRNGVPA